VLLTADVFLQRFFKTVIQWLAFYRKCAAGPVNISYRRKITHPREIEIYPCTSGTNEYRLHAKFIALHKSTKEILKLDVLLHLPSKKVM